MANAERRHRLLALIVDEFVASAQPIGSKALIERHKLQLSSATVRNEMAALEEQGLLTHPHTSAGRVPSDEGYRFYVRTLMPDRTIPANERLTILHQFHQSAVDIEAWLRLATGVLAQGLGNVAVATPPRDATVRLKRLQLVELSDTHALVVIVTGETNVIQHTIELAAGCDQEELNGIARKLNDRFAGKTPDEIRDDLQRKAPGAIEETVMLRTVTALEAEVRSLLGPAAIEGIREMLRQPEFGDTDRVLDTLDAMDGRQLEQALPADAIEPGSVSIVIGDENRDEPYQQMSFVLTRYGDSGSAGGVVGILGPTRMDYGDAVSHVRYVSAVLSELLNQYFGEPD